MTSAGPAGGGGSAGGAGAGSAGAGRTMLYPPRRAVENAVTVPGVLPLRLFPVLWPLWQVDISASVHDPQAFEVLDHFLVRALAEGALSTVDEIAAFFSLPAPLVLRCLDYLVAIGHVTLAADPGTLGDPGRTSGSGSRVALTSLGMDSWRSGVRLVRKESRQTLMFERFTGWPFPRPYYEGTIAVLPTATMPADGGAGPVRFHPLSTVVPLRPGAVDTLAARPDRAEFNMPAALGPIQELGTREGYLPCYLVETSAHGLFVYSAVSNERDAFLGEVCRHIDSVRLLIEAEDAGNPHDIWTAWLARHAAGPRAAAGPGTLTRTSSGVWRIILPPSSYGETKVKMYRLGSFELSRNHLAQLWCEDTDTRRTAAYDRALALSRRPTITRTDLLHQAHQIAATLEVPPPALAELRTHARATGAHQLLGRLDLLTDGG